MILTETPSLNLICTLDATPAAACNSGSVAYNALAGGTHQFTVVGTDPSGHVSAPVVYKWSIDLTPPQISNLTGPQNCIAGSCSTTITFAASDSQSTIGSIMCKVNGGSPQVCQSPFVIATGLTSLGQQSVEVDVSDAVGNVTSATYGWTILANVPTITSFTSTASTIVSGQSAVLNWAVTNASTLTLNGVSVTSTTSQTVSPTQTTTYTLTATASSGVAETNSVTIIVLPPATSVTSKALSIIVGSCTNPLTLAKTNCNQMPGSTVTIQASAVNANNSGVAGIAVRWSLASGGGTLGACDATTDQFGNAKCSWVLGANPGANLLYTYVDQVTAPASLTLTTSMPVSLTVSGSNSSYVYPSPNAFNIATVLALDAQGAIVSNAPLVTASGAGTTLALVCSYVTSAPTQVCATTSPTPTSATFTIGVLGTTIASRTIAVTVEYPTSLAFTSPTGATVKHGGSTILYVKPVDAAGNVVIGTQVKSTGVTGGGMTVGSSGTATSSFGFPIIVEFGPNVGTDVFNFAVTNMPTITGAEAYTVQ